MKYISSRKNEIVKKIKYLHTKKGRDDLSQYIVEGEKLSNEALLTDDIDLLVLSESFFKQNKKNSEYDLVVFKDDVFDYVSGTVNPQGIMAVLRKPEMIIQETRFELLAEGVQDPGNLGTIIRTCESFGIRSISLTNKCADPYSLKTVRASMGSILRTAFNRVDDVSGFLSMKKNEGYKIYAGHLDGEDIDHGFTDNIDKAVLIIGNESTGVSPEAASICDKLLRIPIYGRNESLNASVAAGILLYELRKRFS